MSWSNNLELWPEFVKGIQSVGVVLGGVEGMGRVSGKGHLLGCHDGRDVYMGVMVEWGVSMNVMV